MTVINHKKKPVVLRPIRREPLTETKNNQVTGLGITCPAETTCPHCQAVVTLAHAEPLANQSCPSCGGTVFAPGRLGGFLLRGHIAEGETGTVYLATDESLDREVAIKFVRRSKADNPASREHLRNEACVAGGLNHPRVAQVYALNFSNGHPYLVMELVSGLDFAKKLERETRMDERAVLKVALDVAEGLSVLNREGLVHGDIKPENLVIDRDGHVKLVDFGFSGVTRHCALCERVGSSHYIAPELLAGAAGTHRSDLFSLGATLYHLLTGRPPCVGEKMIDVLKARLLRRSTLLASLTSDVSAPTRKLIMELLESDPQKRPATSDAVANDVRHALTALSTAAPVEASFWDSLRSLHVRLLSSSPTATARSRQHASIVVLFGPVIVGLELLIAIPAQSFPQTWTWLRQAVATRIPSNSQLPPARPLPPASAEPPRERFTLSDGRGWQSMNLGGQTQRGSTMQMGGTLIIQGPGADRSKGDEDCRFVWTRASGDYTFSAHVKSNADNGKLTVTGLLVKGADPTQGSGLLLGILGGEELFLEILQPNHKPVVVKRSGRQSPLPVHLTLTRRGTVFEASVSADGIVWTPFAACELNLPDVNTVGFSVSAHDPATLATGTFANIRLQ